MLRITHKDTKKCSSKLYHEQKQSHFLYTWLECFLIFEGFYFQHFGPPRLLCLTLIISSHLRTLLICFLAPSYPHFEGKKCAVKLAEGLARGPAVNQQPCALHAARYGHDMKHWMLHCNYLPLCLHFLPPPPSLSLSRSCFLPTAYIFFRTPKGFFFCLWQKWKLTDFQMCKQNKVTNSLGLVTNLRPGGPGSVRHNSMAESICNQVWRHRQATGG